MNNLRELSSVEDLDRAIKESDQRVVLVFKHSLTCPISSRAFREFESFLEHADPRAAYNLITIQTARSVSNEAAARLETPHESPQALLLKNQHVVWSASHYEINEVSLREAIQSATASDTAES